jgi:hypothetical protein
MLSPLPYDIHTNRVRTDMQTATALMDSVASGRKMIQLICSPSGFGKTTIAKKRFKQRGIVSEAELYSSLPPLFLPAIPKGVPQSRLTAMRSAVGGEPPFENARKKLFVEARPTKPISLVRTLHLCAMLQASALLFDDPGRIAADEASCDILKTGFGMQRTVTYETPEITRNENQRISGHGGYDPFLPPPDFRVPDDLRWLWLANTNYTDAKVLAKLGDHFAPLIARGLNPFWIRDDVEHDHRDLFLYVHYKATEENLLRSLGFPYDVSRKAVNFFVTHADRLIDLGPRRLELIAKAFAADLPSAALEAELHSMAPTVIRPNLKLPTSWITVPDGALLWPEQPFAKTKSPVEGEPPRRIRRREREHKHLHEPRQSEFRTPAASPDPDPDPPPAASQPVRPDPDPELDPVPTPSFPDPDSMPTLRPISGERGSPFDAIDEVYRQPIETTCQMVVVVLRQYPLDQWDKDDFDRLVEGLEGRAEWSQCAAIVEPLFALDTTGSHKVFCTETEGVLEYRDERLEICSWESIEQRIAPALDEQRRRIADQQREQRGRDILDTRLPKVRKLKAVKPLAQEFLTCQPTIKEQGRQAIDYILAMSQDDPQFADCATVMQYLLKATEILEHNSGSEPEVDDNVVEFKPSKPPKPKQH